MKTLTTNKTAISLTVAFGTVLICVLPAQARFDYDNWQPVQGRIHQQENRLEQRLNKDYNRGMIDSNELAQMRRDLDGIKTQEDEFRVDHNGLGQHDVCCLKAKLNESQQDLNRAEVDK
ncbi:MAG: hypothetical protein SGJ27_23375 [Candidatus Melainabacteria bacterium]|nr:hypothetical protein [Candidatus Melainabacteria bacterium]